MLESCMTNVQQKTLLSNINSFRNFWLSWIISCVSWFNKFSVFLPLSFLYKKEAMKNQNKKNINALFDLVSNNSLWVLLTLLTSPIGMHSVVFKQLFIPIFSFLILPTFANVSNALSARILSFVRIDSIIQCLFILRFRINKA